MSKFHEDFNTRAKDAFSSFGKKLAAGTALAVASAGAMAADHSTAINGAITDGSTNLTAAVTGLITLIAIVVGVGYVISCLRKS